jgi:hypothetical protein
LIVIGREVSAQILAELAPAVPDMSAESAGIVNGGVQESLLLIRTSPDMFAILVFVPPYRKEGVYDPRYWIGYVSK